VWGGIRNERFKELIIVKRKRERVGSQVKLNEWESGDLLLKGERGRS